MPIRFSCPECGKELQTPDEAAGKRIKCRSCQTAMIVPGGAEPETSEPPPEEPKPRKKCSASKSRGGSGMKMVLILGSLGLLGACVLIGGGVGIYFLVNGGGLGGDSKYLPDNVTNLQVVDIDDLKSSAAWSEMQKCPNFNREFKFFELGGKKIDPAKIVIARKATETVFVMTMKKSAAIGDLLGDVSKAREVQIAGKTVHDVNGTAWFIDGKRVVVGPEKLVRSILERKGEPKMTETMKSAMKEANFRKPMVAIMDMSEFRGMAGGLAAQEFDLPDAMVAESDFRMPMNRRIKMICKDSEMAKRIADKAEKDRDRNKKIENITIRASGSLVIAESTDSNACDGIGVGL